MSRHQCETSIELDDGDDVPVIVNYTFSTGRPARPWGDSPDPGDPDELEIEEVIRTDTGELLVLGDNQMNELYEYIQQNENPLEEEAGAYADYCYDRHRDRLMEEQYDREHGNDN
jgi:hypothetical protein